MISSTLKNRTPKKYSAEHVNGIKLAARYRRQNSQGEGEIRLGVGGAEHGDSERLDFKVRTFLSNTNSEYLWANYKHSTVDIEFLIRKLQRKMQKDLSGIQTGLLLFFTEYLNNLKLIEEKFPFPKEMTLTQSNYGQRFENLNRLKLDGFKKLMEILEGAKQNDDHN